SMESGYNFGALSWAECEEMCARLEKSLVTAGIDTVLVVARGGLSVAGMLLKDIKPRCIRVVKASSYSDGTKRDVGFDAYSIQTLYELR
ncbi:hypothetical protein, partial [Parvimonas sp. D9]|uniref:hypothetical protein n=1 Tax=Parvimonas sp. D9 TaxID=3110689 RepID=UPI002B45DCB3